MLRVVGRADRRTHAGKGSGRVRLVAPFAAALLLALAGYRLARYRPAISAFPADHHMHLGSVDLCARVGECGAFHTPPAVLAADAIRALDLAHVRRGVVLSTAYIYGLPSLGLPPDSVALLVRRENEFTAAEVAQYPDRLAGFLSVDPLQPSALEELAHWRGSPVLRGLKLHLTVLGVDLTDSAQRARVAEVVGTATAQGMPIVIHVGGGTFGAREAEFFIADVLPRAGSLPVQIAHGAGGLPLLGDNHVAVLRVFAKHILEGTPAAQGLLFDLSFVPAPGEDATTTTRLMREIRRIGLQRFVFASDFDVQSVEDAVRALDRLGLTAEERATLARSCAPWACPEPEAPSLP